MHSLTSGSVRVVVLHTIAVALASAALCGSGPPPVAHCGAITGGRWVHVVSSGETWTTIGAREGVDPEVLAARNGSTVRVPLRPGDVLGIDNRHIVPANVEAGELVINVPQRMLFHYWDGVVRAHYPIAVGRPDWPTPLGSFTIVSMEADPTWDVPLSLGRYWMGLSLGRIGLHGTSAPSTIYHFATHGCIRLHPDDVEDLFHDVAIGERGRIVYQPVLVGFDGADLFLEVHGDAYRNASDPLWLALELLHRTGLGTLADLTDVVRVVREAEGLAVPITARR
jgi:L,D-transpeptidase ErfK/SrfK